MSQSWACPGQLIKSVLTLTRVREKFRDLRWVPLEPEFIEYPNAQFLMIGEAQDNLGKAATAEGGKQPHEEEPGQELEKLEEENEHRVEALEGTIPHYLPDSAPSHESNLQATRPSLKISACMQRSIPQCRPPGTPNCSTILFLLHWFCIILIPN